MKNLDIKVIKKFPNDREDFIHAYIPFIIKIVSKTLKRYVDIDNDDEFSIGLIAFNEAIDRYEESKGNFFTYAELIIKSRLIDYKRKEKKVVIVEYDESHIRNNETNETKNLQEQYILKEEIMIFEKELKKFKISISDLTECSPKQDTTVLRCEEVANLIISNTLLKESLYNKRKLPSTSLSKKYGYSKKFLKLYRKYIIAEIVIYNSSLDLLKEWISSEGGKNNVL